MGRKGSADRDVVVQSSGMSSGAAGHAARTRSDAVERFELTLVAEQGRYAEALRRMAEVVQEEFARFASPPTSASGRS